MPFPSAAASSPRGGLRDDRLAAREERGTDGAPADPARIDAWCAIVIRLRGSTGEGFTLSVPPACSACEHASAPLTCMTWRGAGVSATELTITAARRKPVHALPLSLPMTWHDAAPEGALSSMNVAVWPAVSSLGPLTRLAVPVLISLPDEL